MLTRSQILSRLHNAQGNLSEERSKILRQALNVSGPTEQETEQPPDTQKYRVDIVPQRGTKSRPPRSG